MPGKSWKADIYLEVGTTDDNLGKPQVWLAKVDVGRLGWTARWKRYRGEIKYVYVRRRDKDAGSTQG